MANIYKRSYLILAGLLASWYTPGFFHARTPSAPLGRPGLRQARRRGRSCPGYHIVPQPAGEHLPFLAGEGYSPLPTWLGSLETHPPPADAVFWEAEDHTNVHFKDCHWLVIWDEDKVGGSAVKRGLLKDSEPHPSHV